MRYTQSLPEEQIDQFYKAAEEAYSQTAFPQMKMQLGNGIAERKVTQGKTAEAEAIIRELTPLFEQSDNPWRKLSFVVTRANTLMAEGRNDEAFQLYQQAATVAEQLHGVLEYVWNTSEAVEALRAAYADIGAALTDLGENPRFSLGLPTAVLALESLRLIEIWTHGSANSIPILNKLPPALRSKILGLRGGVGVLEEQLRLERLKPSAEISLNKVAVLERILDDRQREYAHAIEESLVTAARDRSTLLPEALSRTPRLLPSGHALLAFYPTEQALHIFVATTGGTSVTRVAVPERELSSLIVTYLSQLGRAQPLAEEEASLRQSAEKLYDLLIKPISEEIAAVTNIGISGTGMLRYLPFPSLYREGDYLVREKSFYYVTPLSMMGYERAESSVGHSSQSELEFLAVSNPDGSLPEADKEVSALSGSFKRREILSGSAARKDKFSRLVRGSRIVHMATHAYLNDDNPSLSYLLFSGTSPGDQQLRVTEIGNMDFSESYLVVLSACQTAARSKFTETGPSGMDGMAYEFERAGARSIMASLWKVNDRATRILMEKFYRNLVVKGQSKSEALRQAQIEMADEKFEVSEWSSFILIGHPE